MERVFGTLQKRLPQELRVARIKTVAGANRYLKEQFVPDYNARFAVPAAEPGSAFNKPRTFSRATDTNGAWPAVCSSVNSEYFTAACARSARGGIVVRRERACGGLLRVRRRALSESARIGFKAT